MDSLRQSKKRRELWEAFSDTIHGVGGWLVSTPGAANIRFEVVPGSTLPECLREAGHLVNFCGEGQRIEPMVTSETLVDKKTKVTTKVRHGGFVTTAIWEIVLPADDRVYK
jgi:hypothetical protein